MRESSFTSDNSERILSYTKFGEALCFETILDVYIPRIRLNINPVWLSIFKFVDSNSTSIPDNPSSESSKLALSVHYALPRDNEKLSNYTCMNLADDDDIEEASDNDDDDNLDTNEVPLIRFKFKIKWALWPFERFN